MCRIAGIITKSIAKNSRQRVAKMCTAMQHGGPDGEGIFVDENNSVCFGHRRLALLDLTNNAAQPMIDVSGNYTITFNGEIYNYPEIRAELTQIGYSFKSASDTEVILNAYAHWGTKAFAMFNGMFAFALFDKFLQQVFLVRDQQGIKPLYYQISDQGLVFASEVRAFREIGIAKGNKNWKVLFLAFGFVPEPATTLEEVFMLPKSSFLTWNIADGDWKTDRFVVIKEASVIKSESQAIKKIHQELTNAVSRHLIADAPIGIFLSGGIDSSIITIAAAGLKKNKLVTLSVTFAESAFNESNYQQLIAQQVSSDHHTMLLNKSAFLNEAENILKSMDQPSVDGINTWFIARWAKQNGLKAVLSGVGGDELFGGYPSFKRIRILKTLSAMPAWIIDKIASVTHKDSLLKLSYLKLKNVTGYYLALRGCFTIDQISGILNIPVKEVSAILKSIDYEYLDNIDPSLLAANLEKNIYMQNQLLRDADVMSMQHGIEIRVPFLDNKLVQLVESINPNIRFNKKIKKGLLIKSFIESLPSQIYQRKKMGFSFPLQKWLKTTDITAQLKASENPDIAYSTQRFLQDQVHWAKLIALHLVTS